MESSASGPSQPTGPQGQGVPELQPPLPGSQPGWASPLPGQPWGYPAPQRKRRSYWWVFLLLFFVGGGMLLLTLGSLASALSGTGELPLEERFHSLSRTGSDKIAIITIEGTILDGEGYPRRQIDQIRKDMSVKAIILRVNSPGGTVSASDYIYHHLNQLTAEREIPLVVSMGGVAASGGYYISMSVGDTPRSIFAEPTTWTGSVGVAIPHYDLSGLLAKLDVTEDTIKSHRLKMMGSPFKEMTTEEREIFQGLVDDSFARFKDVVRSGRPKFRHDEAALNAVATGQVFTTRQALDNGLVDREGFIEDAIDRAIELAGLDKANTRVVRYREPFQLFGGLLATESQARQAELRQISQILTPCAYYLWAWPVAQ